MVLDLLNANGTPFHDIKIYDFEFTSETMGGKKITCSFLWKNNTLVFTKKEYVMYNDEKFTMSKAVPLEQKGMLDDNTELKGMVKYTCEFSSDEIILENIYISDLNYDDVVVQTRNGNRNFYFYDNVSKFASFINANLSNTIPTLGWTCVTQTGLPYDILSKLPEKPIPFNDNTVAEALKSFYDNYKVPFYIENKTIYLGMPSVFLSKTLKFGQGLGLKNNDRIPKNNKVITRIAGRGSDKNLPFRYPIIKDNEGMVVDHPYYRDHLMPTCYVDAVRALVVDGIPTKIIDYYDAEGVQYPNQIDPDMPLLGIKEFDIFPTASYTLIGMVTLVDDLDDYIDRQSGELRQSTFKVKLPILPFDLYAQANVDGAMTLSMTSGACKGSQFKVAINDEAFQKNFYVEKSETIEVEGEEVTNTWIEFDPDNPDRDLVMFPKSNDEQIELELFKDIETWGKNYVQPNKWQYVAADSFNFLNIEPPESMITSAQTRLDNAMKAYLLDNNTDKYEYPLVIDEYFLQQNEDLLPEIKNNCLVKFDFNGSVISLAIQTITISYGKSPLPKYDIKLTDEIVVNLNSIGQLHDAVDEITTEINSDKLINSRRTTDYYSGLKKVTQGMFDADGNNRINDLYARVLYANAAIFGQESSNFAITGGGVTIDNVDDLFIITGGATIQHFWDVIIGTKIWSIPLTNTFEHPHDSTDIYYLYVKANRADSSARWIVSKDQKKYDSVEDVYYFIAGTFAPMIDGGYKYYSQNGQTSILGGTVALTNIQSPNYEDLGETGIYGMCIDFLNGRLMAGNGAGGNFITINKKGDGKVRIRGAIVQDSAGNASPILTDRGNWVNTERYYVGNYFNYNGSSYQCIVDTLIAGILPTNTTYFKPFALKGDPGATGGNTAIVYLYQRSASEPDLGFTTTLTYTFSTKAISGTMGSWTATIPSGTNPLYVVAATAYSNTDTDTIAYTEWSTPVVLALNGTNGLNSATVYLYQRSASEPAIPSTTLTYTFATGVLSGTLGSWTQTVPTTNGNPCYVITATSVAATATDTILTTEWSTVRILASDGKGITTVVEHYLATASGSGVTTATAGWTTSVQAVTATNKYLWNYETITYTDASTTNSAPTIIGVYGDKGVGISSVTEHYLATTLSTGVTTATAGWTTTIQTVTTTNKYLWNYETVNYTDSTTANTLPVIIGVYGDTGAAGNFQQFIYYRTETEAEKPEAPTSVNEDSYVPTNWYITPQGTTSTYRYEWVCKREKVGGTWGDYSATALWSNYALNGRDGVIYQSWYKLSATKPSAPTTTQVDNPDLSSSGWYNSKRNLTASEPTEWTSQREKVNGVWSAFSTPPVVSGKFATDGKPGQDGISVVMQDIVNINCNANGDPRSGTLNQDMYVYAYSGGNLATIDDYSLTLTSGTATATIDWVSMGILRINVTGITTDTAKFNVYIRILTTGGAVNINRPLYVNKVKDGYGGAAKVSRGEYQNGVEYHGTYLVTDVVSVTVGGTKTWYQALVTAGNITNIKPGVSVGWGTYWKLVTSYDEIATGGLFAENANVAEFIFNGGKMRSQYPLAASMDNKNLIIDGVNGKITALDAVIKGNITAETGSIGPLNILTQGLISGNIKISNYPVTPLTVLKVPNYEYFSRQSIWTGISETGGIASTQILNIQNKGTIQFKIQMFSSGSGAGWKWYLRKSSDNSIVASGQNDTSLSKDYQDAYVYPGDYYLSAVPYTEGGYIKLYGVVSDDIITNRYYDSRTVLADGGFYCLKDDNHYLYCQPSSLFELRIGNGGLRVTDSGVFKTTNGGTNWNPL